MPSKQLRPKLYSLCGHKDSGLTSVKDVSKSLPLVSGASLWSPGRLVEAPPRVLQPCTAGSWELQLGIILHVKGLLSRVLSDKQSYRVIIEVALLIFSTEKEKYLICPIWRSFMDQHLWLAANPFSCQHWTLCNPALFGPFNTWGGGGRSTP